MPKRNKIECNRLHKKGFWIDGEGKAIKIKRMDSTYIKNVLRYLIKKYTEVDKLYEVHKTTIYRLLYRELKKRDTFGLVEFKKPTKDDLRVYWLREENIIDVEKVFDDVIRKTLAGKTNQFFNDKYNARTPYDDTFSFFDDF